VSKELFQVQEEAMLSRSVLQKNSSIPNNPGCSQLRIVVQAKNERTALRSKCAEDDRVTREELQLQPEIPKPIALEAELNTWRQNVLPVNEGGLAVNDECEYRSKLHTS
jgi:hypothetical protein